MHSNLSRRRLLTAAGAAIGAVAVSNTAKAAKKRPAGFTYCLNTGTIRGQKLAFDKEIEVAQCIFDVGDVRVGTTGTRRPGARLKT